MRESRQEMKKERESNFELCRLACMFYIVFYHLIIHVPGIYDQMSWAKPLATICHVGVVVFVMISGYFGINRSLAGFLKIALSVSFYNLLGILIAHFAFAQPFDPKSLLSVFLPVSHGGYWFITTYLILYLIAPYVNRLLDGFEKKEYWIFLAILSVLVFYLGGIAGVSACNGRGILAFILSYSIGRFIHTYYPEGMEPAFLKKYPFWAYLTCAVAVYLLIAFAPSMVSKGVHFLFFGYNEIGLYVMSVLFLLSFQHLRLRSLFVNRAATAVLGIYLIHENHFIRDQLFYQNYSKLSTVCGGEVAPLAFHFLFAVVLLVFCILFDQIRGRLFNVIFKRWN